MALERKLLEIPPQLFTSDGTSRGKLVIADPCLFRVKQDVIIESSTQSLIESIVQEVLEDGTIIVGPRDAGDRRYHQKAKTDLSAYLVADGATIRAERQGLKGMDIKEIAQEGFERGPISAFRNINVDKCGHVNDEQHPVWVQLTDGSINIGTVNAELEVQLSHQDNIPDVGDIADSVQVGDGVEIIEVNPDGSINVVVLTAPVANNPIHVQNTHNIDQDTSFEEIFSFTSTDNATIILQVECTGGTFAHYRLKVNGTIKREQRSTPTNSNVEFIFEQPLPLVNTIKLTVEAKIFALHPPFASDHDFFTSLGGNF